MSHFCLAECDARGKPHVSTKAKHRNFCDLRPDDLVMLCRRGKAAEALRALLFDELSCKAAIVNDGVKLQSGDRIGSLAAWVVGVVGRVEQLSPLRACRPGAGLDD
jgi:hypothetical protein